MELDFKPNSSYVDNRSKAVLDDVALKLQQDPILPPCFLVLPMLVSLAHGIATRPECHGVSDKF